MASLRLFGPAREAAGVARAEMPGRSVAEVLGAAEDRYGPAFAKVVAISRVWVNGESATSEALVADQDEVAVVPPVSGG
jgi:molybdopterin converting factor small subunit